MKIVRLSSLCIITLFSAGFLLAQPGNPKPKATLNHVAIFVVDLQKTIAFYNGFFQLDTIPEPFHDGKHAWFSISNGVAMHVIQGAPVAKEYYKNNHICFSVASVEEFTHKLKATNIKWEDVKGVVGEITTRVDGVKQIWVNDPDGYWVEVNDARF
jgi:lactoylglutathione lyase